MTSSQRSCQGDQLEHVPFPLSLKVKLVKVQIYYYRVLTEINPTFWALTGLLSYVIKEIFLQDIENYVAMRILNQEQILLMGDFNIHVENTNDAFAEEFIDLMKSMDFSQIVHSPTHTAGGTLDLIFIQDMTTVQDLTIYNESNDVVLSDHYLIEISLQCAPKRKIEHIQKTFRSISNISIEHFSEELNQNLSSAAELPLEEHVTFLFSTTHSLLDKYAPLKHKSFVIK